jgi:hypothetical protein
VAERAMETATPTDICPSWYVLVTSASGNSVFATMGPYPDEAGAKSAAIGARAVHYRLGQARRVGGPVSALRRFG